VMEKMEKRWKKDGKRWKKMEKDGKRWGGK
jgi:hypothetical protein